MSMIFVKKGFSEFTDFADGRFWFVDCGSYLLTGKGIFSEILNKRTV